MQPVERAFEAALIVIQNGRSTVAAEQSFSNILKGYKKEGVAAVWLSLGRRKKGGKVMLR